MPNARRAALTVAVGVVFAILVFGHVPYVNGPDYWQWAWQRRGDLLLVVGCLALASSPAFLAQRVRSGTLAVALLGLSVIALQFTANAIQLGLHGVRRIEVIAHDQLQTSYFTVAASIVAAERAGAPVDWLGDYDEILRHAPQHATTKPPGPLAFYVAMVRVAGPENAPMAIAVVIGLLSAAAVVATWVGVRIVAGEEAAHLSHAELALVRVDAGKSNHDVCIRGRRVCNFFVRDAASADFKLAVHREHDQANFASAIVFDGLGNRGKFSGLEILHLCVVELLTVVVERLVAGNLGVCVDINGDEFCDIHQWPL